MSDDAIHDILEQTESDPAFQALYDLFDYSERSLHGFRLVCRIVRARLLYPVWLQVKPGLRTRKRRMELLPAWQRKAPHLRRWSGPFRATIQVASQANIEKLAQLAR